MRYRYRFSFILASTAIILLFSLPAHALQCEKIPFALTAVAQNEQHIESNTYTCVLDGEAALHLGGKLSSSLVQARGIIEVRFANPQGKHIQTIRYGPWVGDFNDLMLDETFAVPRGTTGVSIVAKIENTNKDTAGKWQILAPKLSPGVLIIRNTVEDTVISTAKHVYWSFSTVPATAKGEFKVILRNQSGQMILERNTIKTDTQTEIDFGKLPLGYYQINAHFIPEHAHPSSWRSTFVVLPDGQPPNEPRFGIDGALSWLGGSPEMIKRSVRMMRQAGIGTVRDRLKWGHVQPTRQRIDWGHYEEVAQTIAQAGMESVQVFHDFPDWVRSNDFPKKSSMPPLDSITLFEFGQFYAKGLGKTVRNIEYWNEQNAGFFTGYPFQYTNGLKSFFAGVKSIDPNIRVLIGAAAGNPGQFFEDIYRNGADKAFDTRNLHFYGNQPSYGKNIELDNFLAQNVTALERNNNIYKKPAWITETGYSLHRDSRGNWQDSELKQAEYLVKIYASGFAAGYERVFFFIWRELLEANWDTWGIVHEDLSPRPAYFSLALLTRFLEGASAIAIENHGMGRTVYFRKKNNELLAITWGGGTPINRLGTEIEIHNIFGQKLNTSSPEANSSAPILISHINALPVQARKILLPEQTMLNSMPLRLDAKLRINGKDQPYLSGDKTAISVNNGDVVETIIRAYSNVNKTKNLTVECLPGSGLTLQSPNKVLFEHPSPDGVLAVCRYIARLTSIGESYIAVQAQSDKASDVVWIALKPNAISTANEITVHSLMPNGECPRWIPRQSSNITLTINTVDNALKTCPANVITSQINRPGDSWVFPAITIPENTFATARGLRLKITAVSGYSFPPTPLMLQIVEKSGGIWVTWPQHNEEDKGTRVYYVLFNLARLAPWSHDDNGRLDVANVREIMVGWGGHNGNSGQKHGFMVKSVDILENISEEK
jgi:hypothetical protein